LLKFGYKASAEQFGPNELLAFSCFAEEVGFDSVFVSDHFQPWKHTGGHAPFSFAWLGALGAKTTRVQIGTSVATPTFRYHPSVVAQAVGTLGAMFANRVIFGVGTGESLNEVPATGMKWPGFRERQGRLRESITLMRRLWTEERVTFEGKFNQVEAMELYPKPVQQPHPPIWIGARTDKAARRAARLGHHLLATIGPDPAIPYRDELKLLGPDPAKFSIAQLRVVYVAESADRAWRDIQDHLNYMMGEYAMWLGEANDVAGDKTVWELKRPEDLRSRRMPST